MLSCFILAGFELKRRSLTRLTVYTRGDRRRDRRHNRSSLRQLRRVHVNGPLGFVVAVAQQEQEEEEAEEQGE